jgi:hypothetical protein
MTQKWKNSGYAAPDGDTVGSTRFTNLQEGLETALSDYSGTDDPSDGAPTTWGASEVGFKWYDTTNQRYGSGDDVGGILKRWEKTGASSYGWRTLNAVSWVAVSPNTNVLNAVATNTIAYTDLDLTATATSYTIRALLNVQVRDTLGVGTGVYASFRQNGVTADAQATRVYPAATSIPQATQMWVGVDTGQILEYQVAPYSATGNGFDLRIDLVAYQERI